VVAIHSNQDAFVALKSDRSVVCWGHAGHGGYLPESKRELLAQGVVQVASSYLAFAAITISGSVVAWGHSSFGGDSSEADYLFGW
jgi:hypothetical protein